MDGRRIVRSTRWRRDKARVPQQHVVTRIDSRRIVRITRCHRDRARLSQQPAAA
jgi:hypothetical protein